MGTEALAGAIDEMRDEGAALYGDAESVKALVRQLARLEALTTAAVAAFDASGDWAADNAANAGAWITFSCRVPRGMAKRLVHRARCLRRLPVVAQAWAEGAIGAAQVDVMVDLVSEATDEALARDEALLVEKATTMRFDHFARVAHYWGQLADPDGTEDAAEARRARRDVYLAASLNGMFLGKMTLDPISGSIVKKELDRIEHEMFVADWAQARRELGRDPSNLIHDLPRTPAQRRADALVEMAARSALVGGDVRHPAPLFSVLVDWDTLSGRVCELAEGIVVSPGDLVSWLSVADLERAVFGSDGRVEVSATQRLFTGATRRAIELRDRECRHPFCDVHGCRCQADHIIPWAAGGRTTQDNGRLLCGFHNRLRNQRRE